MGNTLDGESLSGNPMENLNYYEYALIIMYKTIVDGGSSIGKSPVVGGV